MSFTVRPEAMFRGLPKETRIVYATVQDRAMRGLTTSVDDIRQALGYASRSSALPRITDAVNAGLISYTRGVPRSIHPTVYPVPVKAP